MLHRHGRRRGLVDGRRRQRRPTSTSTRCSAATPRSSAARRRSSTAAGSSARRIRSCRSTTSAPAACRTRCPSSRTAAGRGARFDLRDDADRGDRHVAARDLVQRGAGALRAGDRARRPRRVPAPSASASAARSRWSARATDDGRLVVDDPQLGNEPVDMPLDVLLGKPPKMQRDVQRVTRDAAAARPRPASTLQDAAHRVLRHPTVADKTLPRHDRRPHRRRPVRARPDGRPVAGAGGRLRRHAGRLRGLCRRGDGDGRAHAARADRRAGVGPHGGRRGDHQPRRGADRTLVDVKLSANWMAAGRPAGRGRGAVRHGARGRHGAVPGARHLASRWARIRCRCAPRWRTAKAKSVTSPLSLIVSAFAPVADVRAHADAAAAHRRGDTDAGARRPRRAAGTAWAARSSRRCSASSATTCPTSTIRALLKALLRRHPGAARAGMLLAYHDRSDGGLFATVCEMAFAGHCGVTLNLDVARHRCARLDDVDAFKRNADEQLAGRRERARACARSSTRSSARSCRSAPATATQVMHVLRERRPRRLHATSSASPTTRDEIRVTRNDKARVQQQARPTCSAPGTRSRWRMQALRDNPACADEEYDRIVDARRPGPASLHAHASIRPRTSRRRSSRRRAAAASRSCASRASTARSRWRPRSTAPASTRSTCT